MGKFINTEYRDTVQSISDFGKSLLKNQYYRFNDKQGVVITNYWNINKDATSLDPGSLLEQDDLGDDSPIRFNYIEGLIGYGFPRIELDMDNGDFGLESSPIHGEFYVLPNTIVPCEGDFFEVPFIYDGPWLFKVMKVGRDTLENGSNVFKLEFVLDRTTNEEIKKNTVEHFVHLNIQDGTNTKAIVENTKYQMAKKLDDACSTLKGYYSDLFFNRYVQTFVVEHVYETKLYDPFLIEFMIRNNIMQNGNSSYISVSHQAAVPRTFAIDYDDSVYGALEEKSIKKISYARNFWTTREISEMSSIFHSRFERYVRAEYVRHGSECVCIEGSVLDQDLIYCIEQKYFFENDDKNKYLNIIIKYFYDEKIVDEDLNCLDLIDYEQGLKIFYLIPILIFCMESYIKKLLR